MRYPKLGGATRRRFSAIYEKPQGGCTNPPVRARVNTHKPTHRHTKSLSFTERRSSPLCSAAAAAAAAAARRRCAEDVHPSGASPSPVHGARSAVGSRRAGRRRPYAAAAAARPAGTLRRRRCCCCCWSGCDGDGSGVDGSGETACPPRRPGTTGSLCDSRGSAQWW